MEYEDIKHKLPPNFINKPGTVILVDDNGEPWYQDNGDGTFSGFSVETFQPKQKKPNHRIHLWPHKKKGKK